MKVMNINKSGHTSDTLYTVPEGKVAKILLNEIRSYSGFKGHLILKFGGFRFIFYNLISSNDPVPTDVPASSDKLIVYQTSGSSRKYTAVPRVHYLTSGESMSVGGGWSQGVYVVSATIFEESI